MSQPSDPDPSCVQAVRAGDRNAFRPLVERHAFAVLAVVRSFVRDESTARDLAQDSFVRAYERLHQFDPDRGAFRTWLLAIARNRCRDALRRRPPASHALPELVAEDVAEGAGLDFQAALSGMSPEHRVAFLLVHVFEMSMADAAQIEDVPVGTIKSRASRARERLRGLLLRPETHHEQI